MPVSHSHQLLCVPEPATTVGDAGRPGRVGDVPDLVPDLPKLRSRYTLLLSARGSSLPSQTRTICAPPASPCPSLPEYGQVLRLLGIGHVDNRRAVALLFSGERIELSAAVVTDVGDPAIALFVDSG